VARRAHAYAMASIYDGMMRRRRRRCRLVRKKDGLVEKDDEENEASCFFFSLIMIYGYAYMCQRAATVKGHAHT